MSLLKPRATIITFALAFAILLLAACDNNAPERPEATGQATQAATPDNQLVNPTPTEVAVAPTDVAIDAAVVTQPPTPDENAPQPTEVTATGMGAELTALQALAALKPRALAWQADARLGLLSNVRPGRQKDLLGDALGRPEINEPTPHGKGRNWTLLAFSPSAHGAAAISMDGAQVDLEKEGAVTDEVVARFTGPDTASLTLAELDVGKLTDSDAGGEPLQVVYELFTGENDQQSFIFFDAATGKVVLDSSTP